MGDGPESDSAPEDATGVSLYEPLRELSVQDCRGVCIPYTSCTGAAGARRKLALASIVFLLDSVILDSYLNPCRARVDIEHKDPIPAFSDFLLAFGTKDALEGALRDKLQSGSAPAALLANRNSRLRSSKNFSRRFCSLAWAFSAVISAAHTRQQGLALLQDLRHSTSHFRRHPGVDSVAKLRMAGVVAWVIERLACP